MPNLLNPYQSAAPAAGLASALLADSPKFLWKFNETVGTNPAEDSSPNNMDATLTGVTLGTASIVPSTGETCGNFAGGGTANSGYSPGALTTFSMFARIRPSAVSGTRVVFSEQGVSSASWVFRAENSDLKFYVWHASGALTVVTASAVLAANTNYSVGAELDATHMRIYVNGSNVASLAKTAGAPYNATTDAKVAVGSYGPGAADFFNGRIAYAAFFETAPGATRHAAYHAAA